MKKVFTSNEMVYYTGESFCKQDFSGGENCLTTDERLKFLQKYQIAARRWYSDDELNQKAVTERELSAAMGKIDEKALPQIRKEIRFQKMNACEVYKVPEYENIHLYCGATIHNDEIIFPEKAVRPTPCALFELNPQKNLTVSFEVFIPKSFSCSRKQKQGTAQAGRVIEIRSGTLYISKIKLYNTGEIYCDYGNMWVPSEMLLGEILFDEWNQITIEISDTVSYIVNGIRKDGIEVSTSGFADNIFFDGGMFPREEWKIRNLKFDGVKTEFSKNTISEVEPTNWHEVSLPYVIGGYKNRDTRIYLTKKFFVNQFDNAILYIQTLDPCGKVWINDNLVLDADNFLKNEVCITPWLKKGENEIRIVVEPRAPEVYYFWHRHTDCYNGWFCGEVSIILTQKTYISETQVITNKVYPTVDAIAQVSLNEDTRGYAEIFISECFPAKEKEKSLGRIAFSGDKIKYPIIGDLKLWNADNPVIYNIRVVIYDENFRELDDFIVETGFRTINQKNGGIYLNDKKTLLNGALIMQFLPPLEEIPINHNCPSSKQITEQMLMLKKMNGNLARLHMLGYGTNDSRYARICDRLGVMLIWTTRLIDSLETMIWDDPWSEKEAFGKQIKEILNYPSIIMYEGSNEFQPTELGQIDKMYKEFVDLVDSVDTTRLITPCSHLYYGEGFGSSECVYYTKDGTSDDKGNPAKSGDAWLHEMVIKSCHPYIYLCGYGMSWNKMRNQDWVWQEEMLKSKKQSYLMTEFAITALSNPQTAEAKECPYIKSYETVYDENAFGTVLDESSWKESQAYQALCAFNAVKYMRKLGVDGMTWCCLSGGANNASYMKPPIDFYGYKKLGFYALRDAFQPIFACKDDIDVSYNNESIITPVINNDGKKGIYDLCVKIENENGVVIDKKVYDRIEVSEEETFYKLEGFTPRWEKEGYYSVRFELSEYNGVE